MSHTPFFIIGASRSGTTMLRLLLNAHSSIGVPKEMAYFERCARAGYLDPIRLPSPEGFAALVRGFLDKKQHALEGVERAKLEASILTSGPPDLARPIQMALDAWAQAQGKSGWGEKTPKNLFFADCIHALIPEARFLYIVRDPRAVVYSMNRFPRFASDSVLNAFNWRIAATEGYQLLKNSVPAHLQMAIRYEDLVSDVPAMTERICSFLDLPFEPAMLEFYTESRGQIHAASAELGGTQTLTKPISTVSVDRWREGLTAIDVARIEAVCGDVMQELGYELEDHPLSFMQRLSVHAKLRYCQWQQRRNRHLRAYIIAFKPFERSLGRLKRLIGGG